MFTNRITLIVFFGLPRDSYSESHSVLRWRWRDVWERSPQPAMEPFQRAASHSYAPALQAALGPLCVGGDAVARLQDDRR